MMFGFTAFAHSKQSSSNKVFKSVVTAPPLYRVRKNDMTHWVLGTMHAMPLSAFEQSIQDRLADCDILMTESLDRFDHINAKIDGPNAFDRALKATLSQEQYDYFWGKCEEIVKSHNIAVAGAKRTNPEFLFQLYLMFHRSRMDSELLLDYRSREKSIVSLVDTKGLESLVESSSKIHTNYYKCQALASEVKRYLTQDRQNDLQPLINAYCQDIEVFFDNRVSATDDFDIHARKENKAWAQKFLQTDIANKGKSILVACGAAHLYGAGGLLKILREDYGYTVSRVIRDESEPDVPATEENVSLATRLIESFRNLSLSF